MRKYGLFSYLDQSVSDVEVHTLHGASAPFRFFALHSKFCSCSLVFGISYVMWS